MPCLCPIWIVRWMNWIPSKSASCVWACSSSASVSTCLTKWSSTNMSSWPRNKAPPTVTNSSMACSTRQRSNCVHLKSMLTEFDIIAKYFQQDGLAADPALHLGVMLGIGDDCALLSVPRGKQIALSMDVLVEGVHFPAGAPAELVAQRALAVNLSDLAAMGAEPFCFMLGLTLPQAEEAWLDAFGRGLRASALKYKCPLVGG